VVVATPQMQKVIVTDHIQLNKKIAQKQPRQMFWVFKVLAQGF
jgi:hypothetical protein